MGLGAIPLIVHPVDEAVEWLFNVALRPALQRAMDAQRDAMQAAAGHGQRDAAADARRKPTQSATDSDDGIEVLGWNGATGSGPS